MASQNRRLETDVTKLMMSDFKVELEDDDMHQLVVEFHGPKDNLCEFVNLVVYAYGERKFNKETPPYTEWNWAGPYEGGLWKILVTLINDYPYKSPSVGFVNTIFHPNVEESSGSICLDVLNETWSPMFDLMNIFEMFLPQLLLYPNPSHPLNKDAAKLMIEDPTAFKAKVKEYIEMFANTEDDAAEADEKSSEGSEDDNSSNAKD